MRVWAAAHAVDDFYQGLVPAVVPNFVLGRHYSYLGAFDGAQGARQANERRTAGRAWHDNDLVFCHENGDPYTSDQLN